MRCKEEPVATTRILISIVATLIGLTSQNTAAAPGDLDLTFGTGGSVSTPVSAAIFGYSAVAIQPDGKILVASDSETTNADLGIVRYDPSGALDPTWGTAGVVIIATSGFDEAAVDIELQPDGKVLVAAANVVDIKVVRLDSSGNLDTTWGSSGTVWTNLSGGGFGGFGDLLLLNDGRLLVAGSFLGDFAITRYSADGVLDVTFGGNGMAVTSFGTSAELSSLAVQADGKILATGAAGGQIATTRHFDTGVPDPTFGTAGIVLTSGGTAADDLGRDLLVQPDGKIVVLGQDGTTDALDPTLWLTIRLDADGSLDPAWGGTGIVDTSIPAPPASSNARAILRQSDGKIIVAGESLPDAVMSFDVDFATVRFAADGSLDTSWGGTGIVLSDFGSTFEFGTDAQLQADGKLIVAGSQATTASILVARYEVGPYCGDGVLQGGETCDDGNGVDGDCCSATCTYASLGSACEDEGDACTSDTCDGAGTCVHAAVGEGASCEDGNPCTLGETCGGGICSGGVPSGVGCVNPFVCYKTRVTKGHPKFPGQSAISLADDLETGSFDVKSQFEVCVPAAVNDVEVLDAGIRRVAYKLKPTKGEPKHIKQTGIVVQDHFGIRSYDTKKAELLLSPAHLSLVGPPAPPAPGVADHFKCYKARISKGQLQFPRSHATAADEFEDRLYDVFSPRRLCFPVDKDGQGITDATNLITCYRLRRSHFQPSHDKIVGQIHTADDLGDLRIDTSKERDLCLPATLLP